MDGGEAFGRPGSGPTWTSSDKDLVTTALAESRLWATLGHGILNEVYWPSTGEPQIRDLGFIVAGPGWWREIKRGANYTLSLPRPYVPLPTVVHTGDHFRLILEYLPDPERDVLLIRYRMEGDRVSLYPLLAPHLGVSGHDNTARVTAGRELLAERGERALCLASDPSFRRASAGYVGASDGWQDFNADGRMTWEFEWAGPGNIALMGELAEPEGLLALALAARPQGAQVLARSSLADGFDTARSAFIDGWEAWGSQLTPLAGVSGVNTQVVDEAQLSAAVLKVHQDFTFPGAVVASLSIPWGNTTNEFGGYHRVWPRDAVETGLAMAAIGEANEARNMLAYLVATQQDDGHWSQNMFPDGTPSWTAVQLDEVAFPIVLAGRLGELATHAVWGAEEMTARAARFIARNGPVTQQDRWEENAGWSPFTLGVAVAALVVAAGFLEGPDRDYALGLADSWNECIEPWTYATGGSLAHAHGVPGHFVRIAPPPDQGGLQGQVKIANRDNLWLAATDVVGLEFLYLVRLGLRQPDDPRVLDSLKVAEAVLGRDLPTGRAYLRYNEDGYGEHDDGRAYSGTGRGRPWPLLVGERGHYAHAAGDDPAPYLDTMEAMAGPWGMKSEQVWDGPAIPERGLAPGRPTGSAMPLVWAHAEFIKLLLSRQLGQPLERLQVVWDRYHGMPPTAARWYWRSDAPFERLPTGRGLVVEDRRPFFLHFGFDGWQGITEHPSAPIGLGMYGVTLEPDHLRKGSRLDFTRRYDGDAWEGRDHCIALA